MIDKLGLGIQVGDIIAYGHALGRCAGLRIGKVLKVKDNGHLTVWGVDDDGNSRVLRLCTKPGTLQFGERIIVLRRSQVPEAYLSLLDEVAVWS